MPALVIKSFPKALHVRLKRIAAEHRRSVTQETIHLIELAMSSEEKQPSATHATTPSYWATRKLLPEYEAALKAGAFSSGTDSTQIISEERDAR
jgi:plasmid stability protein